MTDNRRKHPRFEIVAQVQLGADGDVLVYPAANLSVGGVFVSVSLDEVSYLAVGARLDVTISGMAQEVADDGDPDAPPEAVVRTKAKIVRLDAEAPGLALECEPLPDEALASVKALLAAGKKLG